MSKTKDTFLIKEIFLTLQGEGLNWGMPSVFVRLGECNLRCTFCDTDFLSNLERLTVDAVAQEICRVAGPCRTIVFTGGEPLLQQNLLVELMALLGDRWFYCIETNGTIAMEPYFSMMIDWVCISPKVKPEAIKLQRADEVKVVFTDTYRPWIGEYGQLFRDAKHFCISPEALPNNPYTLEKDDGFYPQNSNVNQVIEFCKENPRWRLNLQTHKILHIR